MINGDKTLIPMLAPIAEALGHPDVTDIVVNEPGRIGIRRAGAWEFHAEPTLDFETLDAATILIAWRTGREFDEEHPYVNSTLPGGQRFQGIRPPGTKSDRILWAIRRPPTTARKVDDPDFEDLFATVNSGVARRLGARQDLVELYRSKDWRAFFRAARLAGMSICCCGATSGGKTDFLRRMIQIHRPNTRVVTIETDEEFGSIGPENLASMFFDEQKITADEAVRTALRLAPNEIWYQEVRGGEAYALLRAMESGHAGGGTSWHAEQGRELEALSMMARQHPAGREMSEERLMEMMRSLIDILVYCEREPSGRFRISSVRFMAAAREQHE